MMIPHGPQKPVLVVAHQADDPGVGLPPKSEHRVDTAFRVGTAVDVVAKENEGISSCQLAADLPEQVVERGKISVDVADGDGGHPEPKLTQGSARRVRAGQPAISDEANGLTARGGAMAAATCRRSSRLAI